MRILVLNYEYPPVGGGGGHVSHQLARELVGLGHEIDVLTMSYKGSKRYEVIDGVNVFRVPSIRMNKGMCLTHEMAIYDLSALYFALKMIRKKTYDLCHAHFIIPTGVVAFLIKKLTGLPYVLTAHGSDVPGHNPIKFSTQHKFVDPVWNVVASNASHIISPSQNLKDTILNVKDDLDVTIIPNGFYSETFDPYKTKTNIILMVGRLLKFKGYQHVLNAVKDMDLNGFRILIAGDGTYLPNLEAIERLLEPGKVTFLGWMDPKDLKKLYERSKIFILASECESFGLVLLEAMSAGCAVITTNIPTCSEVIGEAGLTVNPGDVQGIREALKTLINDEIEMNKYSTMGIERVTTHFHWKDITKQYLKIFHQARNVQ